ncbi:MAG TPA: hypothetical protein VKV39_00680 [Candidatus Sulfotelmatobacter sp.]|nr:hypothetical protein [Candidatus Sulfotelmatobacter sp.]
MNRGAQVCVLLLLAWGAATPFARGFVVTEPAHPARCHDQAPSAPVPANHECCATSHDVAHPSAAFSVRAGVVSCGEGTSGLDFPSKLIVMVPRLISSSIGPPGLVPLRI